MICASCNFRNEPSNKFCGGCGNPLARKCGKCAADLDEDALFCGQCGSPVVVAERLAPDIETERRFVTVMFCDLEGSTEMSSKLDPEELHDVIKQYQAEASRVIDRHEGYVAQYLGDGILVYFGYPVAHEDDELRALAASLEILDRIATLSARLLESHDGLKLAARIGIHSGPVVAGEIGAGASREKLALGQTPNIAARLESIAASNTVVASKATRDQVDDSFTFEPLGLKSLKGVPDDIEVFRVSKNIGDGEYSDLPTGQSRTPLVGRQEELRELVDMFKAAQAGNGAVAELIADPGLGKSRLMRAFLDSSRDTTHTVVYGRSAAIESTTSFSGLSDLLKRRFQLSDSDSDLTKVSKIEAQLVRHGVDPNRFLPIFASLLSIGPTPEYEATGIAGAELRSESVEAVIEFLMALAREQPLLLVFEDLHWADSSTLEVLDKLVGLADKHSLFCLMTTRPVFQHEWSGEIHRIELRPLQRPEVEAMVTAICGGKKLPSDLMDRLVEKADGIPLYAEEVTKLVLESPVLIDRGDSYEIEGGVESILIPTTLHGWLTARLDKLGTVKELAQVASVLGREFSVEMLSAIAPVDEKLVRQGLATLEEAEIVYANDDQTSYIFKHALICDAAYSLLLRSTRRQLHGSTARILVERFPRQVANAPELVAGHFEAADEWREATTYWSMAARSAMRQGATVEAVRHVRSGLALIQKLGGDDDVNQLEMGLQTLLAESLAATQGYVAPEVEAAYARAQQLGKDVVRSEDQFWILLGISFFHIVRGDLVSAEQVSEQLIGIGRHLTRADLECYGGNSLTCTRYFEGKFVAAMNSLDRSIALVSPGDTLFRERTGSDIAVNHLYYKALLLWHHGFHDGSRTTAEEAVRMAREQQNDYSLVTALIFAAIDLGHTRRDYAEVLKAAREVIDLATGQTFGVWALHGQMYEVWAQLADPEVRKGISMPERVELCERFEAALQLYRASGAKLKVPIQLCILAESFLHAALPDRAWEVVSEGISLAESGADQVWLVELYLLKSTCLRARGGSQDECEQALAHAVKIARSQGSVGLERRAATKLGEEMRDQGREDAVVELLAPLVAEWQVDRKSPDYRAVKDLLESCTL